MARYGYGEISEPCLNQDGMNQHIMCTLCKCLLLFLMEVKPVRDCPLLFRGLALGRWGGGLNQGSGANFISRLFFFLPHRELTTYYTLFVFSMLM